jgi:isoleucyl-tRNA synthetase
VSVHDDIQYAIVLNENKQLLVVGESRIEDLEKHLGPLRILEKLAGKDLVGTEYTHLFHAASAPRPAVFAAAYVTDDSGTGLVHSAPAHGHDDYDAFKAAGISLDEMRCPVDDDGCFTLELLDGGRDAGALVGLPVLGAGSKAMVKFLADEGVLLAAERIEHRYPCDWRTKQPIIIR